MNESVKGVVTPYIRAFVYNRQVRKIMYLFKPVKGTHKKPNSDGETKSARRGGLNKCHYLMDDEY